MNFESGKILLGSDVIRHFIKGESLQLLFKIFKERLVLLNIVKSELCRSENISFMVTDFVANNNIEEVEFPENDIVIYKTYTELKKRGFADGESGITAMARYNKLTIAGSGLKSLMTYCYSHQIPNLTTIDILGYALNKNVVDTNYCNEFISNVQKKNSYLSFDRMEDYLSKEQK